MPKPAVHRTSWCTFEAIFGAKKPPPDPWAALMFEAQVFSNLARFRRSPSRAGIVAARPIEHLLIVGNGMVGQRLCERLVALGAGSRYRISVVGEEEVPAYDRVHLTDIWRGRQPADLLLRDLSWYREHGIQLWLGEHALHLDRTARLVTTRSGQVLRYDKLVIATGSGAAALRVPIGDGGDVFSYRTMADARTIFERANARRGLNRPIVIIGGGLLGLEAASSLRRLGFKVVVLEASSQILPRQLDPEAAVVLAAILSEDGLAIRLRARVSGIERLAGGVRIDLSGEPPIEAALVVSAVGAKARDELARQASLRCDVHGGIAVDSSLATADPQVFAIGECASFHSIPHGVVAPGYAMAEVLAQNLMGGRKRLGAQQVVTRLKLDTTEVSVLGNPLESGAERDLVYRRPGSYRRLLVKRGRVVAAISVGPWNELASLQQAVEHARRVSHVSLRRFTETGELGCSSNGRAVANWPDAAVVCQCASVSCGALRRELKRGSTTPALLSQTTSAGTLCGSCRPLLLELCGGPVLSHPAATRERALGVLALLAGLLALATLGIPKIPAPSSMELPEFGLIWFDPFCKQATGFSLLLLVLLGFALSLRKRVTRFQLGSYSNWRKVHAALGAVGLVALFGHTGFRLGNQFNLLLMTVFLASALTGAASGMLLSVATQSSNPHLARGAALSKRLHDFAFWALPVLISFHVLKTYYY